jgi:hypothetical protein
MPFKRENITFDIIRLKAAENTDIGQQWWEENQKKCRKRTQQTREKWQIIK